MVLRGKKKKVCWAVVEKEVTGSLFLAPSNDVMKQESTQETTIPKMHLELPWSLDGGREAEIGGRN